MKENYTYAAVFNYEEDEYVNIEFPMFEGAFSCVPKNANPIKAAQELLTLFIQEYESTGKQLPDENETPNIRANEKVYFVNRFFSTNIFYYRSRFRNCF